MQQEKQKDKMIIQEIIPPGLRFYPTEEELVSFYLHNKLEDKRLQELNQVIPVINIYALEPWQLPKLAGELCNGDTEQWFFFVPRQEREARGGRPSRTTTSGYWKATGSPSYVYSSDSRVIGVKKSLVFYKGKAPTGRKTKWKMNEYRAIKEEILPCSSTYAIPKLRHEVSLCRVYVISGSFQAFDRRPIGVVGTSRETMTLEGGHNNNNYSSQSATMMEIKSSLEITPLPKEILFHNVDSTQGRNCVMEDGGLRSLLEWQEDDFSHIYAAAMNDELHVS